MTIVPLNGRFTDWKALLHRILEDDSVTGLVIVTIGSDGWKHAFLNMTHEQMAYAALMLQQDAMGIPDAV